MEYMITNYREDSTDGPAPGTPEFAEMMGAWMAYNQMLIDGGHWVGGASLAPSLGQWRIPCAGRHRHHHRADEWRADRNNRWPVR